MVAIRHAYRGMYHAPAPQPRVPMVPREISPGEQLLADIEAFLQRHPDISQTRFGREACGNDKIVPHLQRRGQPRAATTARIRDYMRAKDRA